MGGCCGSGREVNTKTYKDDENQKSKPNASKFQPASKATHETTLQRDIRLDYKFGNILGNGHFGTVRIAQIRPSEGAPEQASQVSKKYAVKTIQKVKVKEDMHLLKREIEFLFKCDHPNIIKCYYTYEDQKYLHIVMELCEGGELFDRIIDKSKLSEQEAATHFSKILSAIKHLHENGIAHRDIKPENFLFETKDDDSEIKMIDFGLANKFGDKRKDMNTMVGTPYYVAPEVLTGEYGRECDLWSLGVVLYSMLSGSLPFGGNNNIEIFKNIRNAKYEFSANCWSFVSSEAKALIKRLLIKEPKQRITIQESIEHQWFKKAITLTTQIPVEIFQNMKNYRADIRLRKEAMNIIVKTLAHKDIQDLNKVFHAVDKDKTGYINATELKAAINQCGLNVVEEEINQMIREADYVGNGKINYSEFIAATLNSKVYMNEEKLWQAFSYFDTDKSGYITKENLQEAFSRGGKNITPQEIEEMIKDVDIAHDNRISFKEFQNMMDPSGLMVSEHYKSQQKLRVSSSQIQK